jgi:flagellar FliL protein
MKAKLPMIAMVAVGLAIGGGTGAMFVGPMFAKKFEGAPDAAQAEAAHGEAAPAEDGGHGEPAAAGAKSEAVHVIDNLVLNPAGSGGSRFLLLSVALESGSPDVASQMTARDAELRDIILTNLGTKTVEQLTEISVRDSIKSELIKVISSRFGKGAVKRLYFPTFVVQ